MLTQKHAKEYAGHSDATAQAATRLKSWYLFVIGVLIILYTPYGFFFLFTVYTLNLGFLYYPLLLIYGTVLVGLPTTSKLEISILPVGACLLLGAMLARRRRRVYGKERPYGKFLILLTTANAVPMIVIYAITETCQLYAAPWVKNCGF